MKDICELVSDLHFSFKYFKTDVFAREISPMSQSGHFLALNPLMPVAAKTS